MKNLTKALPTIKTLKLEIYQQTINLYQLITIPEIVRKSCGIIIILGRDSLSYHINK